MLAPALRRSFTTLLISAVWTGNAAALTPTEKCAVGKLRTAGTYALCRLTAAAKAERRGADPDYTTCDTTFAKKWGAIEAKAGGLCPANGDAGAAKESVTQFSYFLRSDILRLVVPCRGGNVVGGFCWFIGDYGQSCDRVCADHGFVYDSATKWYAGSGGSDAHCTAVLDTYLLLEGGANLTFHGDFACDQGFGKSSLPGLGCLVTTAANPPPGGAYAPLDALRCEEPATTSSARVDFGSRLCACHQPAPSGG